MIAETGISHVNLRQHELELTLSIGPITVAQRYEDCAQVPGPCPSFWVSILGKSQFRNLPDTENISAEEVSNTSLRLFLTPMSNINQNAGTT